MRRFKHHAFKLATAACAILACGVLFMIALAIAMRGLPAIEWRFFTARSLKGLSVTRQPFLRCRPVLCRRVGHGSSVAPLATSSSDFQIDNLRALLVPHMDFTP